MNTAQQKRHTKRPTGRGAGTRSRSRKPPALRNAGLLLLVVASMLLGIFAIKLWVDVAGGQQVATGTIIDQYRVSLRCGRGGARCDTYRIDLAAQDVPNRTFTIDQGAYGQLARGDQVRLTFATAGGDVFRVEEMQRGHWQVVSDSGAPSWQMALLLTVLTLVGIFFSDLRYHHRAYNLARLRTTFGQLGLKKGAPDFRQLR